MPKIRVSDNPEPTEEDEVSSQKKDVPLKIRLISLLGHLLTAVPFILYLIIPMAEDSFIHNALFVSMFIISVLHLVFAIAKIHWWTQDSHGFGQKAIIHQLKCYGVQIAVKEHRETGAWRNVRVKLYSMLPRWLEYGVPLTNSAIWVILGMPILALMNLSYSLVNSFLYVKIQKEIAEEIREAEGK